MIFKKLDEIIDQQYKELKLKKVSLKTDPKFSKLPYEGYILAERGLFSTIAKTPGKFIRGVGKAYGALKTGSEKFKRFGQGDIGVLADIGSSSKEIDKPVKEKPKGVHPDLMNLDSENETDKQKRTKNDRVMKIDGVGAFAVNRIGPYAIEFTVRDPSKLPKNMVKFFKDHNAAWTANEWRNMKNKSGRGEQYYVDINSIRLKQNKQPRRR